MRKIFAVASIILLSSSGLTAQIDPYNLQADKTSALFTTYAAPAIRSNYKTDQAYKMMWYDMNRGVDFISEEAGNICLAFRMNDEYRDKLRQYYTEPVVTVSSSDMVRLFYYPFKNIKTEIYFVVYSSGWAIYNVTMTNEGTGNEIVDVYPYLYSPEKPLKQVVYKSGSSSYTCLINKERDSWMKEHDIPVTENLASVFSISSKPSSWSALSERLTKKLIDSLDLPESYAGDKIEVLAFRKRIKLKKNETYSFRIIRGLEDAKEEIPRLLKISSSLYNINLKDIIRDGKIAYNQIPGCRLPSQDEHLLYLSAFNLLRQCMMPPEGKCSYNYYVFSREPKWGWGYGGQVFHESLSMLAYMYMDPASAINSQRVFMERQLENGYINYRTGPYLDETIETNGQLTTSAPWFSFENLEIYKRTKDKQFLKEAFDSGGKLYRFFINNRDSDHDGLCEWGGNAELESVRDARVAVWDKVGSPVNFESLDLNCILVNEARSLSVMARESSNSDEFIFFTNEVQRLIKLINSTFWDDSTGFYYNVDKVDHDFNFKRTGDLKIKEITGFLPLWAGIAGKEQAKRLMDHLKNKDEFWRKYGMPTLSADHEYYNPMGYWNGPVWIQWNYLVFRGMLDYGYYADAKQLAENIFTNMIYMLQTDHNFWEFYSPDDHQAGWNKTYIWAGIIARMMIDVGTMNL